MTLKIKDKQIVVPGEILAEGTDHLPALGSFREEDKIISSHIGFVSINGRLIKVIPLSGRYIPKTGDTIIGKITNITFNGWLVDVDYAYEASLNLKEATSEFVNRDEDLSKYYNFGDMIVAKVINVTKSKFLDLTTKGPGLKKLRGGLIVKVTPSKVPRIIGKQGSMISIVKEATGCRIIVGQNGIVWIQGDEKNEIIAKKAILKIDKEAHKEGLTDTMKSYLDNEMKK